MDTITELQLVKTAIESIAYAYKQRYSVYVNANDDKYTIDVYFVKGTGINSKTYCIGRSMLTVDDVISRIVACEKLLAAKTSPQAIKNVLCD